METNSSRRRIAGKILSFAAIGMIRFYQALAYSMPARCRFAPSCSEYAREAFAACGFFGGAWRTIVRLSKCHPWNPGGWDPISSQETVCKKRIS